jgi:hypothetical protein
MNKLQFNLLNNNNNNYRNDLNDILFQQKSSSIIKQNNDNNSLYTYYNSKNNNTGDIQQTIFKNNLNSDIDQSTIDIDLSNKHNEYKYRITKINIDSAYRNTIPKNITTNTYKSLINPFTLIKNSNIIKINLPNHNLEVNDKIIIVNVNGPVFNLSSFEFFQNSSYVKINHTNHGMQPFDIKQNYSNYQIKIDGISNNGLNYIQNIPLNILNNYHTVYFNIDNSDDYDINFYYININTIPLESHLYNSNYYTVTYRHLCGIPLSNINANYPITPDRNNGYQLVDTIIDKNTFTIQVNFIANKNINNCGGDYITIDKITDYIEGYPNNNNYIISLNKTFYNVTKIKLISTEFPNTEKIIKDRPLSRQNNLLYWQILSDNDHIYVINITPGNYTTDGLSNEIQTQIQNTISLSQSIKTNSNTIIYDPKFYADVSININTNIFKLNIYGQLIAVNPFRISQDNTNQYIYNITVNHPQHLLQANTQIRILNSLDIGVIPSDSINGLQTITTIIDENSYTFQIKYFNPLTTNTNATVGGGNDVQIRYPFKSKLLFNRPGTIGNIIGFRNVGQNNSITEWSYSITNNSIYINENNIVDSVGNQNNSLVTNNYINLNGDNYILMTNPLFINTVDTGNVVSGIFAKLLLSGAAGYILFNQFIQLGEEFTDGIQTLSELQFTYYAQDGSLYDFYGIEHSFTIEIYEKINNSSNFNRSSKE